MFTCLCFWQSEQAAPVTKAPAKAPAKANASKKAAAKGKAAPPAKKEDSSSEEDSSSDDDKEAATPAAVTKAVPAADDVSVKHIPELHQFYRFQYPHARDCHWISSVIWWRCWRVAASQSNQILEFWIFT